MENRFTGTVVRATGSWYDVLHDGAVVRCRIRGRLRLRGVRSTNPVVVGDEVTCEADAGGDYVICDISPRRNYVIRPGVESLEGVAYHRGQRRSGSADGDAAFS